MMAAVSPSTMPRFRHSRRTRNQTSPTPGVTLVKMPNTQNAGYRNPSTIIAASSRWMFPWNSSSATGGNARTHRNRRPPSQRAVANSTADHNQRKEYHSRAPAGLNRRAATGV